MQIKKKIFLIKSLFRNLKLEITKKQSIYSNTVNYNILITLANKFGIHVLRYKYIYYY